jgi:hypothetical protein
MQASIRLKSGNKKHHPTFDLELPIENVMASEAWPSQYVIKKL